MSSPDSIRKPGAVVQRREVVEWSSAAVATSGDLTLEVDESLDATPAWQLNLDTPSVYVSIRIEGPGQLKELLNFLERTRDATSWSELAFGHGARRRIKLIRDDEGGRYFLKVGGVNHVLRITLRRDEAADFAKALADVIDQLADHPAS